MTMYRARIETIIEGERKSFPVFPRSRKTTLFKTKEAALLAIERTKLNGRGLIYPASMNYADFYCGATDWSQINTVAL